MITWFSILVLGAALMQLCCLVAYGQVINLRHPESSQYFSGRTSPRPNIPVARPPNRSRFTAKPGNVVVHFDHNHDIQHLQYVLQDGRLATLYQRNRHHPAHVRAPIQVQPPIQVVSQPIHRRDEQSSTNGAQLTPAPSGIQTNVNNQHIDHDQTIDILNSKLNGVSQLIGDHITVELPLHEGSTASNQHHGGSGFDEKLEILGTIATDAVEEGANLSEAKLRKVGGIIVNKLKAKVQQKLRELPDIIGAKLRAKSSVGQLILDKPGKQVLMSFDEKRPAAVTGQQVVKPAINQSAQPSQVLLSNGMEQQLQQPQQQQQLIEPHTNIQPVVQVQSTHNQELELDQQQSAN